MPQKPQTMTNEHTQTELSEWLGRNQLSSHHSSLATLEFPNLVVNVSMPPIISAYLIDNYYYYLCCIIIIIPVMYFFFPNRLRELRNVPNHRSKEWQNQDPNPGPFGNMARPGRGPQEAEALRQVIAKAPGDKRTKEMVRKQEELGGGLRDTAISKDH